MAFKFLAVFAVLSIALVTAFPYQTHEGHSSHGGHGSGGSSHQSLHIVAHDDGHDHGSHGHDHGHGGAHDDKSNSHAEYSFEYGVKDPKSGDIKGHSETRKGHKVSGHYELIDADGHKRTVVYTADKHKGFEATVHREPTHIKVAGAEGHGKSSFHGGSAKVSEYGHSAGHGHGDEGHAEEANAYEGHGYEAHSFEGHDYSFDAEGAAHAGHGGSASEHGFSIVQEHAVAKKHDGHDHGHVDSYAHGHY